MGSSGCALFLLLTIAFAGTAGAPVSLNEFMASNTTTLPDEDGDYPDWIELYNGGDTAIDLAGYALSDNPDSPAKWVFPARVLGPRAFLLVFASGKDRRSGSPHLHTNFRIASEGEEILLSDPQGRQLDRIDAVPVASDIPRARQPDGTGVWYYFANPTPGEPNTGTPFVGVTRVTMAPRGGLYPGPVTVALTADPPQATIYYTRDSTDPTTGSPVYREPITLTDNTVLRARAVLDGWLSGTIATQTWLIGQSTTLPVVSLVTNPSNLWDPTLGIYVNYKERGLAWERPAHFEFFDVANGQSVSAGCGIRIHGGGSASLPAKSFKVYARAEYGASSFEYSFFPNLPIRSFQKLLLRNSGNDWNHTLFRDAMIQSLVAETGLDVQAYRPSILFLNGQYWGIYNLREFQDEHYIEAHYGIDSDAVDILEKRREVLAGSAAHYDAMMRFVAANDLSTPQALSYLETQMDLDNYIDYLALEFYCGNFDWPRNNVRFWRPQTPGGRWRWFVYDLDAGFPEPPYEQRNHFTYTLQDTGWPTELMRPLLHSPLFAQRFVNRYADLLNSLFLPERVVARIDTMRATLAPEFTRHFSRWNEPRHWERNIEWRRQFARLRPGYVQQHIVSFFALSGTATVTLDAEPRPHGHFHLNSLKVTPEQLPWTGVYYRNVPITATALAQPGYRFAGWESLPEATETVQISLATDTVLRARFEFDPDRLVPPPYDLAAGPYQLLAWAAGEPAGTYPPHMRFQQTALRDPALEVEMDSIWTLPYNRTSRSRINGHGALGIAFLNTSDPQEEPGAGYLGAAVLTLKTLGRRNVRVTWTGSTVQPNERVYAVRLQYRPAHQGTWRDVLDPLGRPVEYRRNATTGHSAVLGPTLLSPETANQPVIQLRWKYYFIETGASGARAQLRVDDIIVDSDPLVPAQTGVSQFVLH